MAGAILKVGAITVVPLSDTTFAMPPRSFMSAVPDDAWQTAREYLNDEGALPLNVGCFLLQDGNSWSIVDTGVGPRGAGFLPAGQVGKLDQELKKAGVSPEQIECVLSTHLHLDHIGWNTVDRQGAPQPFFPNARHVIQRKEWEYWTQPEVKANNPVIASCAEPVYAAGLVDLIDGDITLTPAVSLLFTPGHTPGHQSVLIASGGEKAIIMGDLTHNPVQIEHPEWGGSGESLQSADTRAAMFDRIEREGLTVCAGHYLYPSIGTIIRVDGARRWQGI
jgi:glyoxylase-like metal-dependent hydrolase (beta-lactamase superfamily II)